MENTITPAEVAPAPVAAAAPAAPTSLAAAFNAASARSQAPAKEAAPTPPPAEPAKAVAPAKAAAPGAAAKPADPIDAAFDQLLDSDESRLPFEDINEPTTPDEGTPDERVGRRIELLKTEIKSTWKPKVAELEESIKQRDSRLAELEGFAAEREEFAERIKTYEAEMSVTKLERTPAFIKEVTEPETRIVGDAMKIIEHYGLNEKDVFSALEEPDKMKRSAAFKAATSGMDVGAEHEYELRKLADEAQSVLARRSELYENADAALAELGARTERETASQAAARAEERSKATDLIVDQISKKLPFLTDIVNKVSTSAKETNFEALSTRKQAYNVLMGDTLPMLAVAHANLIAERDQLLDELASYTKASPRVDGGLARSGGNVAAPRSLAEAAAQAAGRR